MDIVNDRELTRQIILDNYQNPYNKGLVNDDSYYKENTNNESCIDNIDIEIKIEDNILKDIRFDGEACAISTSATSIMIRKLIGKSVEDAKNILINYKNMIEEKDYDKNILEELLVYHDIGRQPNRIKCALLPHDAVIKILNRLGE